MAVVYEWDVEEVVKEAFDEYEAGDVFDHNYQESALEALTLAAERNADAKQHNENRIYKVVLIRTTYKNSDMGFCEPEKKSWAYAGNDNTILPDVLLEAYGRHEANVPNKYLQEFAKAIVKLQAQGRLTNA